MAGLVGIAALALGLYGSGFRSDAPALDPDGDVEFDVHVSGAVRYPKVLRAKPGMIVQDALEVAGGATEQADLTLVNLAAPLVPNSRVYVPAQGEGDLEKLGPYGPNSFAPDVVMGTEPIAINAATAQDFERLPGIGPALAAAIIAKRNAFGGRFSAIEQLLDVDGIGPKTFERLRPYVKL